ncbi:MAG: hypothetical protein ACJA00_001400 [Myxococcota bacterium]|jgi:hypothetical protein
MAFLRGWALEAYTTQRTRKGHLYNVVLTVPDDWGTEERDAFGIDITRALELLHGMPWLGVREVLAYRAAERAVQAVDDDQASQMFALLPKPTKRVGVKSCSRYWPR